MDQAKNIDMGMGPEQAGLGGFGQYGGELNTGAAAAAAGPGDDYDF